VISPLHLNEAKTECNDKGSKKKSEPNQALMKYSIMLFPLVLDRGFFNHVSFLFALPILDSSMKRSYFRDFGSGGSKTISSEPSNFCNKLSELSQIYA
jgi:hypothetical protein